MKAIWYERQGDASEVLIYGEMEKPTPQNDEVLIKVYYSGLNPSDTKRRIGFRGQKHAFHSIIPHSDGSGIIEDVGSNIDPNRIGERVWVYSAQWQRPFGTAANFVCVPSNLAIKLEDSISLEVAATIFSLITGGTSDSAVVNHTDPHQAPDAPMWKKLALTVSHSCLELHV